MDFEQFLEKDFARARLYATAWHYNQNYAGLDYVSGHLDAVVESMGIDGFLEDQDMLIAAMLHDGPEDAPNASAREARFEIITHEFSPMASRLVRAATGIGENRRARNDMIMKNLLNVPEAAPLKGHDRLVNARTSRVDNPGLHKMYRKEYPAFRELLHPTFTPQLLFMLDEAHEPCVL